MSQKNKGSVLIIAVFAISLFAAVAAGILQINTEDIQLTQNQINAAKASYVAQAGLSDAFNELRQDSAWTSGYSGKQFSDGSYTVTVAGALPNLTVESIGTSAENFISRIEADLVIGTTSPYIICVDKLRINE
jgi:hypothetical protein